MSTITLSEDALVVLKLRLSRQEVEVTEATRPAYRELAAAGLMIPLHTFAKELFQNNLMNFYLGEMV